MDTIEMFRTAVHMLEWASAVSIILALIVFSYVLLYGAWISMGIVCKYIASIPGDIIHEIK